MTAVTARRPSPSSLSLTGKLLQRLVRVCCARPALTVSLGAVLAALGVGYAAHSLTLETSTAYAARLAGSLPDAGPVAS